jgi:hypothetical protein
MLIWLSSQVENGALNQAIRRNRDRFAEDFMLTSSWHAEALLPHDELDI